MRKASQVTPLLAPHTSSSCVWGWPSIASWAATSSSCCLKPPSPSHRNLRTKAQSEKTSKQAGKHTSIGLFVISVDDERPHAACPCSPHVLRRRASPLARSVLQRSRADDISMGGAAQWPWVSSTVDRRHRNVDVFACCIQISF